MLKRILILAALVCASAHSMATDVNTASAAELDAIKGIGPGLSTPILEERKKGNFKDWNDFIARVKGVGKVNAARFSKQGLTVGTTTYPAAAPTP